MKIPVHVASLRAAPSHVVDAGVSAVRVTPLTSVPIPVRGVYGSPPPVPLSLIRAAFTPRPWASSRAVPELQARLEGFVVDPRTLEHYREVMHSDADVPLAFPQLVATQLHMALIGSPRFPFPAAGLVHPRFVITQRRALEPDEPLDVRAWMEGRRQTRSGIEFDLRATVHVAGEQVWESTAVTLVRSKKKGTGGAPGEQTKPETSQVPEYVVSADFEAPADAGRRYAAVSGDYNPIHLHPRTSSLLGYKRPIAHGWWLLGRCLGDLELDSPETPTTVAVEFLRPTLLPASLSLVSGRYESDTHFALLDDKGKAKLMGRTSLAEEPLR